MKSLLNWKVPLAFGSAILALLVVGVISHRGMVVSSEIDRRVRHTHEVLEKLQDLLISTEIVESSYRGFVLTGLESYLESSRASKLSAEQDMAALRTLTVDNPAQQRQIPDLERLAAQKIQFGEMVVGLRRNNGLEAAADAIRNEDGQRITDEFQGAVRKLQDEELRLLVLCDVDAKRQIGRTKIVLILGTVLGLVVAAAAGWSVQRDTFVREFAEEALRDSEEKYRMLLDGVQDYAIFLLDTRGMVASWNAGAERIKGYKAEEIIGHNYSCFFPPEDIKQGRPEEVLRIKNIIPEGFAERLVADALRSGADALAQQIGTGIELIGLRKDGSEFPIEIMLSPLESAEGILVTAAIRDITERKKSEEHLVKTVGKLKRSNDELEQFAYVASHDLQEPLRMVASYTQLLAKRYKGRLDSDADEFIAYAVDGANRMQGLIQDLLAYSRAGANGKPLRRVSSEYALKEALTNLRAMVEESGAVVTHDPLPAITTDDTQLAQVFQNLIGNAIKYRAAEVPRVHISAMKNGGNEWTFSVRDNGLGIDPQYFDRIFILFQRLHGREEFKGTGIGLTICKKIVDRLGGRIWVESQPEKGSTFYFALPEREVK